jgi:dTDP-4-dehydrorhamnose reductase
MAHCNEREWIWLLLSDSRVFPATGKRRFAETDTAAPNTCSGAQLLAREQFIAKNIARHIVLRTGPLIASSGDNLLTRLLHQLRMSGTAAMPEMQRFCPTPIGDVTRVIAAIHDQLDCGATGWGVYHYESADSASSYEFAEVVLAAAAQYWQLAEDPVQLRDVVADDVIDIFPLLNCQRIRDTFGIQQLPWRRAIPAMLKQVYALNSSGAGQS